MEFKMCEECLKAYGASVEFKHPPVTSPYECCGDPEDCIEYENGNCNVVAD